MASRMNLNVNTQQFNFRISSFNSIGINEPSLIFSAYSLHYYKAFDLSNINDFISSGIQGGVHIEPCTDLTGEIYDKLYGALALRYMKLNNYTPDIATAFKEAEALGLITLDISNSAKGMGLLPAWTIRWAVK